MMNYKDCIINIENVACEVSKLLGAETVKHILMKHGARTIEDLNPAYYDEVFDELDFMASDARG